MTIDDAPACVNAALAYAAGGWRVLPVHGTRAGRCTCTRAGCDTPAKHPRLARWPELATTDLQIIHRWWSWWPTSNVGIATGNGLLVLDVDGDVGTDSLRTLERMYGLLPETPRSCTGGGMHVFFTTDAIVPNRVGIAAGLDIRSTGGFVVAPPSLHISGRWYAWDLTAHLDDVPLASAPRWLLDLCIQPVPQQSQISGEELHLTLGERNDRLFRLACRWRRDGVGRAALLGMLRAVNAQHVDPPLLERELTIIATSAAKYAPTSEDDGHADEILLRALGRSR